MPHLYLKQSYKRLNSGVIVDHQNYGNLISFHLHGKSRLIHKVMKSKLTNISHNKAGANK